ncbi:MAG: glycosyltransferase [Thomasclavelia sp.]|nr:glycosyltransferase [Thomasclavelia sp.]
MRYRIDECVIGGIHNPTLFINGWVENDADKLIVKNGNQVIATQEIIKYRSKLTTFNYTIKIPKEVTKLDVYFCNDLKEMKISEIHTSSFKRIGHKMIHKYKIFQGIIFTKMRRQKKERKAFYKNAINMKDDDAYNEWLKKHEVFEPIKDYEYSPKISIIMPVYNVPGKYLGYCLDSILNQTYQNFEICIADDCSTNNDTVETLRKYMKQDKRIKVVFRKENGHISRATNSALELATGEYIGLMDNDDKLDIHALNEVVKVLNDDRTIDFIYTDEDKVDMEGNQSDPQFKPDFALDTLYGGNYICHFSVIRKTLIDSIGGFRRGYEGAQDFDLFLRLTNVTKKIHHISKILYHWRMIPGSTAVGGDGAKNYAADAGKKALEDYFKQKNIKVNIDNVISTQYFVEYLDDSNPETMILIISDEDVEATKKCIESIKHETLYQNYKVTIISKHKMHVTNDSINVIHTDNLVTGIKEAVNNCECQKYVIMNNHSKIITVDWLDEGIGYLSKPNVGIVGCKIINHQQVVGSGIIFNSTLVNAFAPSHYWDYGAYGSLLVPYNYSIMEPLVCFINKDLLNKINDNYSLDYALYDLCLQSELEGNHNIFVPQIIIENNMRIKFNENENKTLNNKYCNYKDIYYNSNLSLEKPYTLTKQSIE